MKVGVVNKSTILNRFVLHSLQRNITHLAVITRKTKIKLGILKGGNWKRANISPVILFVKLWGFKERYFGQFGTTINARYISRYYALAEI